MSKFPLPVQKVVSDPLPKGSTIAEKEITGLKAAHAKDNVKRDRASDTTAPGTGGPSGMPKRFTGHATPHQGKK